MLSRQLARLLLLALSLVSSIAAAGVAIAADATAGAAADPVEKVQKLNRYAMQLFDDGNYALAEKTLLEALAILGKANLTNAPAALSTHGNLAVLYSVGLQNPDKAVAEFKKALVIKPDLKMSKQRATPETEANLARARAEMEGGPAAASKPAPPARSAEPKHAETAATLRCPSGGEIQAGDDVNLKCLSSDPKTASVLLYYKPNGADDYRTVSMTKGEASDGTTAWTATIPGADTNGKWVPIYFEARNAGGSPIAYSGHADIPNVITVKGSEAAAPENRPTAEGEEEGEEDEEGEQIDDSNPLARLENERRRESEGLRGTWTWAVGTGSGVGYAVGHSTEAFGNQGVQFNPGLAPAYLGQLTWDVGYFVGRETALVVAGRHQWIQGSKYGAATGANSVLLKLLFFTERAGRFRGYFSTVAGGGEGFRLRVNASILDPSGNPTGGTVHDTVQGGPAVAGLGGGLMVKLTRRWHWTLDSQVLVGIPKPSTVLDFTTGIRWMH